MTTRRPLSKLAHDILNQLGSLIVVNPDMRTTPSFASTTEKILAEFIQDWLDEDQAEFVLKENTKYYVCKLSSTNVHVKKVVKRMRGFSELKRGDAFGFSLEGFHRADGESRIYQAASDFKNGRICADERYNPEI